MRDPARIPRMVAKLQAFWEMNPDMRLGQVVCNMTFGTTKGNDPFYVEDVVVEKRLDRYLANKGDKLS